MAHGSATLLCVIVLEGFGSAAPVSYVVASRGTVDRVGTAAVVASLADRFDRERVDDRRRNGGSMGRYLGGGGVGQ